MCLYACTACCYKPFSLFYKYKEKYCTKIKLHDGGRLPPLRIVYYTGSSILFFFKDINVSRGHFLFKIHYPDVFICPSLLYLKNIRVYFFKKMLKEIFYIFLGIAV